MGSASINLHRHGNGGEVGARVSDYGSHGLNGQYLLIDWAMHSVAFHGITDDELRELVAGLAKIVAEKDAAAMVGEPALAGEAVAS